MYCIKCSPFDCDSEGLISIATSPNSSVKPIEDDGCKPRNDNQEYMPGPGSVSITINAYAFAKGEDKWLGSRCKGAAQANQTNILRYDAITDKWWFIPSKIHRAQITGEVGPKCFIKHQMFTGSVADAQILNGASITTELGVEIGAELHYEGSPLPVIVPDLNMYTINLKGEHEGYLSSFSLNVDYPTPAMVSYSFECMLDQSTHDYSDFFTFNCDGSSQRFG